MEEWTVGFKDGSGRAVNGDSGAYICVKDKAWRASDTKNIKRIVTGGDCEGVPVGVLVDDVAIQICRDHNFIGDIKAQRDGLLSALKEALSAIDFLSRAPSFQRNGTKYGDWQRINADLEAVRDLVAKAEGGS